MAENRFGREAETESLSDVENADVRHGKQSGTKVAHDLPPNPDPAEGPRDPEYTRDTAPESSPGDQPEQPPER